jgi:asparagine synthase (glutamine-hydrolysing)
MCGICGIVLSSSSDRSISRATLEAMRDVMTHRGPDGSGLFIEPGIALGHRRLSIVDVAHGQQPMASGDDSLRLVYNGEVYNHPSLSAEFQATGIRYNTHCDTETVLHAFERYGSRCVDRLRGMFAFAIWNRHRRELFLARDRLGVKPLYYALTSDGSLYFASEIKSLLAAGAIAPKLNLDALPDYLANHAPSAQHTLFEGIKRLLPGHTLRWRDGRVEIESYWDLNVEPHEEATTNDQDLVAEYRERLRESVRLRLMADVPLGSFLSGGIDSAAITGLMSELVGTGVKTFSVAFAELEANELEYARLVAERFKTDHHEVVVTADEFFDAIPRLVWHEDEPMAHPSSVPLNFVSRLAADHVKVVLTGEGSDETLAGYGRYRTTLLNLGIGKEWERWGGRHLRRPARGMIDALPRGWRTRRRLARTFLYLPADLTSLYFDNFAVFSRARQSTLLSGSVRERIGDLDPYSALQRYMNVYPTASLLNHLLYADTKTYLHELLMKQDQMSMAASIESRVPFLDHPLMEFAARMPERMKLRGGTTKYILRAAMKGFLPDQILSRSKMGFPVPVGSWFRNQYRAVATEYVLGARALERGLFDPRALRSLVEEHQHGYENHWERLWSLVNLEIWQRLFLDGETVADATSEMTRVLGQRHVKLPAGFEPATANALSTIRK